MNKKIKAMQKDIDYLLEINEEMKKTNSMQIEVNQKVFNILMKMEMEKNESK